MEKNKFTTYSLYAIGEIALVVIGILIAIQIDGWKETRKERKRERDTILSLKKEFEENLSALKIDMDRLKSVIEAGKLLYEQTGPGYAKGSINVDSVLAFTMSYPTWSPSNFVLDDIKNSGMLKTMSNDTLRNLLLDWDRFYNNLQDWHEFYEDRSNQYFIYFSLNGLSKDIIRYTPDIPLGVKSDFPPRNEDLMTNYTFENILSDKLISSSFIYGLYEETVTKIEEINLSESMFSNV
jgi:hypothetical protein